jgi:lysophospholipase L1-like esterase
MRRTAVLLLAAFLAGCGADERAQPPPREPPAAEPGRALVATVGDSITAGMPYWDPDPEIRANYGPGRDVRGQYQYWARRALGRGLRFRNCGVPGDRTDQIAARLDACSRGARYLIVQGGLNDLAQGRPVAEIEANLLAMVRRGRRLGLEVAIAELLPWNNGHPRFAAPIDELNRRIRALAQEEGAHVLPWFDALEDPARPGRMRSELTYEGDHPTIRGYRRLGETLTLGGGWPPRRSSRRDAPARR